MESKSKQSRILTGVQGILLILVMVTTFAIGQVPSVKAQNDTPFMFGETGDLVPLMDAADESFVTRSRLVTVNVPALMTSKGTPLGADVLPQVTFNIFQDAYYTGNIDKVTKVGDSATWTGSLAEVEGGYFYMVVNEGVFVAHIASPEGVYEISSVGNDVYKVIEIDHSQLVDDYPGTYDEPGPVVLDQDIAGLTDSGSTIDIMVVYTAAALAGEGGSTAAMKARIALAVAETNTSYANAGVTSRLRLVHTEKISYTETGNIQTDLNRLAATGDGYMDSVHSLRNTYGADMVSLVVENGGGYCGIAKTIMASATSAFDVVKRSGCMTGYYSFGHEFGHLQGARHDVYVDNSTTPYSYGHGYVHTGTTTAARWRTVMAYNNKCSDLGYNCNRLQYWSNPSKTYNSYGMGTATAKNYAVLNATDTTVANFRSAVIGTNFSSSFNSSYSGWYAVKGTWALSSSAYYKSSGLASTGASARHSGKYGDLTYTVKMKRTGTCTSCANRVIIRGNYGYLNSTNQWKPSYMFQYNNNGSFSVWYISSSGTSTALKDWTTSSAIKKNDWNTLKVVAVGSSLKFYINGTLVWTGTSTALKTGYVGYGFYRDAYSGILYVDSAALSTTATADVDLNADVEEGVTVKGGTIDKAP